MIGLRLRFGVRCHADGGAERESQLVKAVAWYDNEYGFRTQLKVDAG